MFAVHGARAALSRSGRREDRRSGWVKAVEARRGGNIAAVALANKNARTAWAVLEKSLRLTGSTRGRLRDGCCGETVKMVNTSGQSIFQGELARPRLRWVK